MIFGFIENKYIYGTLATPEASQRFVQTCYVTILESPNSREYDTVVYTINSHKISI